MLCCAGHNNHFWNSFIPDSSKKSHGRNAEVATLFALLNVGNDVPQHEPRLLGALQDEPTQQWVILMDELLIFLKSLHDKGGNGIYPSGANCEAGHNSRCLV